MNCQTLQNVVDESPLPQLPEAQTQRAMAFARSVGAAHFSYLLLHAPASVRIAGALQSSYPSEWVARYAGRGYGRLDPVVISARRARLPFRWGQGEFLHRFAKVERRVFHEARAFEVTEGWAVPLHGPEGDTAIFSICTARARDMDATVAERAAEISLFAMEFQDAVMRAHSEPAATDLPLSPRERETLGWTAEGLTTEVIAHRLGLSASAINYHLRNACRKLGARNKYHAAILALRRGLL